MGAAPAHAALGPASSTRLHAAAHRPDREGRERDRDGPAAEEGHQAQRVLVVGVVEPGAHGVLDEEDHAPQDRDPTEHVHQGHVVAPFLLAALGDHGVDPADDRVAHERRDDEQDAVDRALDDPGQVEVAGVVRRQARNAPSAMPNRPLRAWRTDSLRTARQPGDRQRARAGDDDRPLEAGQGTHLVGQERVEHHEEGDRHRRLDDALDAAELLRELLGERREVVVRAAGLARARCRRGLAGRRLGAQCGPSRSVAGPRSGAQFVGRVVDDESSIAQLGHAAASDEPGPGLQAHDTPSAHPDQCDLTGAVEEFSLH